MKLTSDLPLQTVRQHAKQIHATTQLEPQIVHLLLSLWKVDEGAEGKEEEAHKTDYVRLIIFIGFKELALILINMQLHMSISMNMWILDFKKSINWILKVLFFLMYFVVWHFFPLYYPYTSYFYYVSLKIVWVVVVAREPQMWTIIIHVSLQQKNVGSLRHKKRRKIIYSYFNRTCVFQ